MTGYILLAIVAVTVVILTARRDARHELAGAEPSESHADPEIAANAAKLERRTAHARAYCELNGLRPRYTDQYRNLEAEAAARAESEKAAFYRDIAERAAMRRADWAESGNGRIN